MTSSWCLPSSPPQWMMVVGAEDDDAAALGRRGASSYTICSLNFIFSANRHENLSTRRGMRNIALPRCGCSNPKASFSRQEWGGVKWLRRRHRQTLVQPGPPFTEVPEGCVGFTYLVTDRDIGQKYIGRKSFENHTTNTAEGSQEPSPLPT
jgi:hypothetical protein